MPHISKYLQEHYTTLYHGACIMLYFALYFYWAMYQVLFQRKVLS